MKVIHIDETPAATVVAEGAKGVTMRVPIGKADGAPGFTMRLFELAPGGCSPRHHHPYEHEIIVWSGSGTLWGPAGDLPLAPGVVALVVPDEEHQVRAGADGLRFFCLVPHHGHNLPTR